MHTELLIASGLVAFLMAWAIGAQDVSNALGTSVGSKAITVRQAIYIAGVCEFVGSLAGGDVAGMISGGILDVENFRSRGAVGVEQYTTCMFATMSGAFLWLAMATYLGLPVSTTHSLVGSLIGVGVMSLGVDAINTRNVMMIISSWVTSPVLGGVVAYCIFSVIYRQVLTRSNSTMAAERTLPHFYGFTFGTLAAFILRAGPKAWRLPLPVTALAFVVVYVAFFLVLRRLGVRGVRLYVQRILGQQRRPGAAAYKKLATSDPSLSSSSSSKSDSPSCSSSSDGALLLSGGDRGGGGGGGGGGASAAAAAAAAGGGDDDADLTAPSPMPKPAGGKPNSGDGSSAMLRATSSGGSSDNLSGSGGGGGGGGDGGVGGRGTTTMYADDEDAKIQLFQGKVEVDFDERKADVALAEKQFTFLVRATDPRGFLRKRRNDCFSPQ